MKIYDISTPIYEGMPVWEDDQKKQPKIKTEKTGYITESRLDINVHSGTHVDAPLHMVPNGFNFETIRLERLTTGVKVFDLTHVEDGITENDIKNLDIQENDFILFKTKNSFDLKFNSNFIFVKEDAALLLADRKIAGVGIDSLGIERSQENHPTHKTLFQNNVIILEGLELKEIEPGEYFMVAAPLKIDVTEAAPARVLLMKDLPAY